jgi:pyruvate/2-oxoglutarate dehydrogenase complex dihydrolipoamide acyltransferase (E2) component
VSSSTTDAGTVDVAMPQMGVSVSEGTIVEWKKQVGDEVGYEETIVEISTDKIDTELPSPAAGRVAEILVEVGATVTVGTVLARLATRATTASDANGDGRPPRVSPVVARIAAEHGLDLTAITGTGRGGRVTKRDALAAVEPDEPPMHIESPYRPEPASAGEPLSRMRRTIGEHMVRSLQTAAHCTTIVECDMSAVQRRREAIGATYLPVVACCVVDALRAFPALNAWLEGDRFTQHEAVHLGVAVSLGENGLIVPVVRDAQDLSDEGLAKAIKRLAARARDGQLTPDDVGGGTFTITNPGAFGAVAATPIINQPQVAILDLEAVVKRPVVVTGADGTDAIAIRPMANLCMSWDHRAIDGAFAARFLSAVRERAEAV